jgi:hypothetical protein
MGTAQFGNGSGVTTTLVALISNAGPEDQATAIAGMVSSRLLGFILFLLFVHHAEHFP